MARITTYRPLALYPRAPWQAQPQPPPPYADFSCRREPDLEHTFPAITGLCRKGKTASFHEGERVAYFTAGRHRLAAVLRIERSFGSHAEARDDWYVAHGLPLPRNLVVPGNEPLPFELTCGFFTGADGRVVRPNAARGLTPVVLVRQWDGLYRKRAKDAPHVHVCRPLYVNLTAPIELKDETAARVFPEGRFPGTQTPKRVEEGVIDDIAAALGITLLG
jgi:hypothetical protein